ncbi:MAG: hypothetical protein ACOYMN_25990, partial [Roseimicrobium sp.]
KFVTEDRAEEFDTLQEFLLKKRGEGESYEAAAAKLGITEVNMRQRVSRFGRKFRQSLEDVIRPMVTDAELDDELSHLWRCFEK